jgi:hypothetical protein
MFDISQVYCMSIQMEYLRFCKRIGGGYNPTIDEYFLATAMAYNTEHPPKYPRWKSVLAKIINKIAQ